ncbi:hypothetical protein Ancab_015307, partial [Ancistrocladus abbreviatus]
IFNFLEEGVFSQGLSGKGWKAAWFTVIWEIWLVPNVSTFSNNYKAKNRNLDLFQIRPFNWLVARVGVGKLNCQQWCMNPMAALENAAKHGNRRLDDI